MKTYLLDTNILLRLIDPFSQDHAVVKQALFVLSQSEDWQVVIVPQSIIELWAVATRPISANGLGYSLEKTRFEVADLLTRFDMRKDAPEIFDAWLEMVTKYNVSGKQVHDTKIVAAMLS